MAGCGTSRQQKAPEARVDPMEGDVLADALVTKEIAMRDMRRLATCVVVCLLLALFSSSSEAQQLQFYTGNGMARVFGCPPLDTLTLNGVGAGQQGDCTSYQTGLIIGPAVPIEAWVATQVSQAVANLRTENKNLQKEVDQLTARVQALEAALNRPRPGAGTK
jgi:hypothetical protein